MKARTVFLGIVVAVVFILLGGCGPRQYLASDKQDPPSSSFADPPLRVLLGDMYAASAASSSPRRMLLGDEDY